MKVYIVLTYTGTVLSKIVKYYTRKEFSHVSISLDKNLTQMYSFGRLNPYNPLNAGFVHEYINFGTFKRFRNTKTAIYELEVGNEEYEHIKFNIKKIEDEKEKYTFNIIGLFAVAIKRRVKRKYSFYCAEFVKYVFDESNMNMNLPEIIKPEDFRNIENLELIYKGLLREYKYETKKV